MARLLESPAHAFRVHPVDEFGLLVDAEDYYREFYRAASQAESYILLSGWQFDSDVALLRGPEAERAGAPVTLLKLLKHLTETKPELRIWILAWDFHLVFAAEREWMQNIVFDWTSNERLQFMFDSNHVERGCHHQKFVVIDGVVTFLGGLDLCDDRWDDRKHRQRNAFRLSDGEPHKPFHDIQAYARGTELAGSLVELFACRWERAGGAPMSVPPTRPEAIERVRSRRLDGLLPLAAPTVALSRTDPHGSPGGPPRCTEIATLHCAAIASAERLIYAETQYFSAHLIADAIEQRMRDTRLPKLDIVLVLNVSGETLKEQAAVGLAQAKNIGHLRSVARETGHALGIYYTLPSCETPETPERATYIHSKLMIVDDRFLTVGSANLTNRSMAVDTELNVSVETDDANDALGVSIRGVRASLLAEHTGGPELTQVAGLVAHLDEITSKGEGGSQAGPCRLRNHPSPTTSERAALALVDPQKLPFDPDAVEELDEEVRTDFLSALGRTVRELFASRKDKG